MHKPGLRPLAMGALFMPIVLWATRAEAQETRFASRNAVEKICLWLAHTESWKASREGRFRMASSNCTMDRDFEGTWTRLAGTVNGDTLILNTDRRPHFRLVALPPPRSADSSATHEARFYVRTADPAFLQGLEWRAGSGHWFAWNGAFIELAEQEQPIQLRIPGMPIQSIPMRKRLENETQAADPSEAPEAHRSRWFELVFEDLYVPSLVNDRWLLRGKTLTYVPRAGSVRTEAIALKKGKRCWYKR